MMPPQSSLVDQTSQQPSFNPIYGSVDSRADSEASMGQNGGPIQPAVAANSPQDKNATMRDTSIRRRVGDVENVLLYIPPQVQNSVAKPGSQSGRESYARPSPQPSCPPPKMSDGGNGRPAYNRNTSLCSTKGTHVSHLRKILDDPFETNLTKQQLARELIKYDSDEDGWVSTGEMLTAIVEVVDRLKMNVRDLDKIAMTRGAIGKKVAAKLHEKDKDGDGAIDADELIDAMEELVKDEESSKFWFRFSMVSCLLTLITIVVIVGLTVALQVSLKDTKVDLSSFTLTPYRGSGQNQALRVASSDFAVSPSGDFVPRGANSSGLVNVATKLSTVTDCPITFDSEYLRHLEVIELDVTADQTLYLKPGAFIIGSGQVTFFTQLGNITFSENCRRMEGEVVEYLIRQGLMDSSDKGSSGRGRRLSQAQGLVTSNSLSRASAAAKPPRPPPPSTIYVSIGQSIDCTKNPPPAGCVDSGCNATCADNGLCLANFYRKQHGAPILTYNKTLEGFAQECVTNTSKYCVMNDCITGKSGTSAYTLATTKVNRTVPTACDALTAWYIEIAEYVFSKTPFTDNLALFDDPVTPIGHFSQLVWRNVSSIGCATASETECVENSFTPPLKLTNSWFINCNYWPSGNLVGSNNAASNALWQAQVCPVGGC